MLKKTLMLFTVCLLILNTGTIYAIEKNGDGNDVDVHRGFPCPMDNCDGTLFMSTKYDKWYNTGESQACAHYPFGLDYLFERSGTTTFTCNNCSYGYSENVSQTKWVCHGSN